jgi:hypothetical protein
MIVVMQCAARKRPHAGHLVTSDGKPVEFVAHPEIAPVQANQIYARPDDISDTGVSWRKQLLNYNKTPRNNPLRLSPAFQLYENPTYGSLAKCFGLESVYILSAGWGLIRSDFMTPHYDITFSQSADSYKRRRRADRYDDCCMLPGQITDEIFFIGGKDYLPLFCCLTKGRKRTAFFNSAIIPQFGDCKFRRFETTTRTNWHYECANAMIEGRLSF